MKGAPAQDPALQSSHRQGPVRQGQAKQTPSPSQGWQRLPWRLRHSLASLCPLPTPPPLPQVLTPDKPAHLGVCSPGMQPPEAWEVQEVSVRSQREGQVFWFLFCHQQAV